MSESLQPLSLDTTSQGALCDALEQAWRSWQPGQAPPRWEQFLPRDDERCFPEQIFLLIQVDIEFRARARLPGVLGEHYFEHARLQQADAGLNDAQRLELIRWEYQKRWRNGTRARRGEYQSAFPQYAAELEALRPRWNCPGCHKETTANDDTINVLHCPNCNTDYAPGDIFRPATTPAVAEPEALDLRSYELLDQLGAGGMGEVYRGRDPSLGRDLAVKVMRPHLRGDAEAEARFIREARITGALQHPGIVPVHNLGRLPDARLYFTMKLVRGQTFEQMLFNTAGRIEQLPELLSIFEKVCQGVAYAHSQRVIHRDLKPANVMVGRFGEVQVMDWGLAKVLSGADADTVSPADDTAWSQAAAVAMNLSRLGTVVGTPAFMAPEQARGRNSEVDERTDVFSLGAVLFVLLTGERLYSFSDGEDILAKAQTADLGEAFARLHSSPADAELLTLCRACLAPLPAERPRDAGVVMERVAAYRAGVQERLRRAELERARAEVRAREERRRRRLTVGLALAVSLLIASATAAVWWFEQRRSVADQAVTNALAEARLLHQQARVQPLEPAGYRAALAAARKAAELGQTSGASAKLHQQAIELVAALAKEEKLVDKDRRLLAGLLDVRGPREGPNYSRSAAGLMVASAPPSADEQFAALFRDWGLDVDRTPTDKATTIVKNRPAAVLAEIVAALDEWSSERQRTRGKAAQDWRKPAELAAALDTESATRSELRQIVARNRLRMDRAICELSAALRAAPFPVPAPVGVDHRRLLHIANQTDAGNEPVLGLLTLTRALRTVGESTLAEGMLRTAIQARASEVVLYQTMGELLAAADPPRWQQAIECFTAARALRPDLGVSLAESLIHGGRRTDGFALFERLVAERPDNPFVHFRRGYMSGESGGLAGAMRAYKDTLKLNPNYIAAHNNMGVILLKRLDWAGAYAAFDRAYKLYPGDAQVISNRGAALHRKGDISNAIATYTQALRLDARNAMTHFNLGLALCARNEYAKAIGYLNTATQLDPNYADAQTTRGVVLYYLGDMKQAVEAQRRAIALDPANPLYQNNLGMALYASQDVEGALAAYQKCLQLDPQHSQAYNNLCNLYLDHGRVKEALTAINRAVAIAPQYAQYHYNRGMALHAAGDYSLAVTAFERALRIDPKYMDAKINHGRALSAAGRLNEAVAAFQVIIKLNPQSSIAHDNLGSAYHARGDLVEAIAAFRQTIKLNPKNGHAHTRLGRALCDLGDVEAAVSLHRRAMELDVHNPDHTAALGIALMQLGRHAEATRALRRALDMVPTTDLRNACNQKLKQCERLLALEKALPDMLSKSAFPADPGELLTLAEMCLHQNKHHDAVHLYKAALNHSAVDAGQQHRFQAARASLQAALRNDVDATQLRQQALDWLRSDLDSFTSQGVKKDRLRDTRIWLARCRHDAALGPVRDENALSKLSEAERSAWRTLWQDVDNLARSLRP